MKFFLKIQSSQNSYIDSVTIKNNFLYERCNNISIPNDSQTISTMLSFAIQLAAIGAVESVLTLQACNEITDTVPKISDSNQECFAQGLANLVCGLFQGKSVGNCYSYRVIEYVSWISHTHQIITVL